MGYLVLMHAKHGGRAPAGDLRLVIAARKGLCQLVIIPAMTLSALVKSGMPMTTFRIASTGDWRQTYSVL